MGRPLLLIDPQDEITFIASASAIVHLKNISNSPLGFRIKTNALNAYIVRPHSGILPLGKVADVNITMKTSTPQANHRFLIQAVKTGLPPDIDNSEEIAQEIRNSHQDDIFSAKLRVKHVERESLKTPRSHQEPELTDLRDHRAERVRTHNQELNNLNDKLKSEKKSLKAKLKDLQDKTKKEETTRKPGGRSAERFTLLHLVMVLIAGILCGYLLNGN